MKKLFFSVLSIVFCFSFPITEFTPVAVSSMTASAEESTEAEDSVIVDNIQYRYKSLGYYEAEKVTDISITSVTIPAKINNKDVVVRDNIFGTCYHLKEINVEEGNAYHNSIDGVLLSFNTLIAYPCAKTNTDYTVPLNVTKIGAAFQHCDFLKSVTFSENVTKIETKAFYYCSNLEEINGVITNACSNFLLFCPKIKHLHFKGINDSISLNGLTELESLIFDDDAVTAIVVLDNLPALKEVSLPAIHNDFTALEASVTNCENLETIHVNNKSMFTNTVMLEISDCPILKKIVVDNIEDGSTEVPMKLKNLPELENITYYEPLTCKAALQNELDNWHFLSPKPTLESLKGESLERVFAVPKLQLTENCGQFTVYGYDTNEVLKYSCEKYDIPFIPLEQKAGDLTGDTQLDIRDVIQLNQSIFGKVTLTDSEKKAADVNGDGIADATDSLLIMKYIVGLIDSFA